jgi:DNA-binding PadR family transcriptional regulator
MSKQNNGLSEAYSYILFALVEPLHGYGIMQKVAEMSQQTLSLGPGTMYGALTNMQKKKWIEEVESNEARRKNYQLTELGKAVVEQEVGRIQLLRKAAVESFTQLKESAND